MGQAHKDFVRTSSMLWSLVWGGAALAALGCVFARVSVLAAAPAETATWGCTFTNVAVQPDSAALEPGTCASCHHFDPALTHPVNVRPTMMTPAHLPLQDGRMTCITCHEAGQDHSSTQAAVGIRGEDGPGLCLECHSGAPANDRAGHGARVGKAHFVPELPFGKRSQSAGIDAESQSCMSCHDGATASEAGSHAVRHSDSDMPADHPIGVQMASTKARGDSDFRLANPRSLDRRVRLFNGAVGCGSCHTPYSKEANQLVISNRGSRLCLTCHVQ